jgi:hypothetical protein
MVACGQGGAFVSLHVGTHACPRESVSHGRQIGLEQRMLHNQCRGGQLSDVHQPQRIDPFLS